MNIDYLYTYYEDCNASANLDNRVCVLLFNAMSKQCKIRRKVSINGVKMWVCASTEQEYVDKVLSIAQKSQQVVDISAKNVFRTCAERWYLTFSKPNVSRVTALTYRRQLDMHILPVIGDKNIEDITSSDIQDIFNRMKADCKQATKNKVRIVLNQIFKMACDEGIISKNPMNSMSLRIKGSSASETKPYTVEQMRYFASNLKKITGIYDKIWLALSISLPLRPEEILGLKWKDISSKTLQINVHGTVTHPDRNKPEYKPVTKTASSTRTISFPEALLKYFPDRGEDEDFVIGSKSPLSYTQLRGMCKRIQKQIGFEESITPRRFRTTVATDISANTHDLKLVQQMLGHSTPQMTLKHYDKGRHTSADAANVICECYGIS